MISEPPPESRPVPLPLEPDAEPDLEQLAARVDRALAEAEALEPAAREKAREVRHAIEAFHKAGLKRIVRALRQDPRGSDILFELVDDPAVYALFAMHGLVRADLRKRVLSVLEMVRPYLESHGGDVELVALEGSTVTVRLTGACHGCSMSATTLRQGVEEALRAHVPEIEKVIPISGEPTAGFVPLDSLRHRGDLKGWVEGPAAEAVEEGRPCRMETEEGSVLILRFGDALYAFRNACAHQGLPLDGGLVDIESGTLSCPWHGFRYDGRSGECLTAPQAQLEPYPLRIEKGTIYVRPQ
ncbi:MAG: NifU family protein [Acidobacteriota bacterium]